MKARSLGTALCAGAVAAALLFGGSSLSLAKSPRKKAARKLPPADFDVRLPVLGTRLVEFPPGSGKAVADQGCLLCHSASMVVQQRLTDKQWARELDKMIGWGAAVPTDRRDELLAYLIANFGPENDAFEPRVTRPVGK